MKNYARFWRAGIRLALVVTFSLPVVAVVADDAAPSAASEARALTLNETTAYGASVASDDDDSSDEAATIATAVSHLRNKAEGCDCQNGGDCKCGEGCSCGKEAPAAGCDTPAGESAGCANGSCDTGSCETGNCKTGNCGCDNSEHCKFECPEACEPWRLFGDCCCLKQHDLTVKGWVAGGITGNGDNPASRFNGPQTFNDRDGEAQLNQLYLLFEKAIDTGGCGWDLGGRVDLLYGTDYRFTIARGLDAEDDFTAKWDSGRFYGLAMPQAYAEVGYNDLSVKVGHFYTILGYEVVTAPDNFFYSHSYTMQYGEPFTHTGVLGTYKANDQLSLIGGVTLGWDNFEDIYDEVSFLGGVTFTASDGNSKLAYAVHVGDEETTFAAVEPTDTRFVQSLVYSRTLTDRMTMVVQSDYGYQDNAFSPTPTVSTERAEWYGVNTYLFHKINCCWTQGIRAEWFRDDDGFRVAPAGDYPSQGFSNNPASFGGFEGNFYEVAYGLNYKPASNSNFTMRPEVRYDWYDGRENALGNQPYDDGGSDDQFTYGFDVIYLY